MASDDSVVITAYDTLGAPLTGLSPTWHAFFNTETDAPVAGPAIAEIVTTSQYKLQRPASYDAGGLIDFGATASPRYVMVQPVRSFLFGAYDAAGAPLVGRVPVWTSILNLPSGVAVSPQPAITDLGSGVHKVLAAQLVDQHIAGTIEVDPAGSLTEPSFIGFDSRYEDGLAGDTILPVIGNVTPAAGSQIDPNDPVNFDVTDDGGLFAMIIVSVLFQDSGLEEVVYDGSAFVGAFVELSSRSLITDGYSYIVQRTGGWTTEPTLKVTAVDASGNKAVL